MNVCYNFQWRLKGARYTLRGRKLFQIFCDCSETGCTEKGNNLLKREQLFYLQHQPFSEGALYGLGVQECKQEVTKVISIVKLAENLQVYSVPLRVTHRSR